MEKILLNALGGTRVSNHAPSSYSPRGTPQGSNAKVYMEVVNELKTRKEDVNEVHLALYLFNNMDLCRTLCEVAKSGADVTVTSIPLTGYDHRKIKFATEVYKRVLTDGKVKLLVYPHMYVWFGAEYAGGGASYSFHAKAGLVKYKDETCKLLLTSGNLAPGDPTHSETAAFMDATNSSPYAQVFDSFFSETEGRAKPFHEHNQLVKNLPPNLAQVFDFSFVGSLNPVDYAASHMSLAFFTAPFITVGGKGSNHYARERLIDLISSANNRTLVCAQHIHDIAPFNNYEGQTIIRAIIEGKASNPKLDARVLKQVSSKGLADKRRAAFVESHLSNAGINQRVNRLVHDKFIIADDVIAITTGNFTATQFGWGRKWMEYKTDVNDLEMVQEAVSAAGSFFGTPEERVKAVRTKPAKKAPKVKVMKDDVFSEVNAFIIVKDEVAANQLASYFDSLWRHSLSEDVPIPL